MCHRGSLQSAPLRRIEGPAPQGAHRIPAAYWNRSRASWRDPPELPFLRDAALVGRLVGGFERQALLLNHVADRSHRASEFQTDDARGCVFLDELFQLAHVFLAPRLAGVADVFGCLAGCPGLRAFSGNDLAALFEAFLLGGI